MRLDLYLVSHGLAKSRTEAARLIEEGGVKVEGTVRRKPSYPIPETTLPDLVAVNRSAHPYVSRGGEKLKAALDAFSLSPEGCDAIDVGASSGGFTDCLLREGARRVFAVDAGRGQLVPSLAADARVLSYEQYNARYMKREDFPLLPTFAVMDVSFISATLILPALSRVLPIGSPFVCLVKPQFEVGREGLGKGGIVREPRYLRMAQDRVIASAVENGFSHIGTIDSPILGGDGNREFLAAFRMERSSL